MLPLRAGLPLSAILILPLPHDTLDPGLLATHRLPRPEPECSVHVLDSHVHHLVVREVERELSDMTLSNAV